MRVCPHPVWATLVLMLAAVLSGTIRADDGQPAPAVELAEVRVGVDEGDVRGGDQRALQAAIDYVAGLGGGTVRIGAGRYHMRNALVLRDNVKVVGVPGKTVLAACDGFRSPLAADGDCNERQITVADPSGFRVGDGVAVADSQAGGGFAVTTATIVGRAGPNTFRLSAPLYSDYLVSNKARASLVFPVIGAWRVKNVLLEGLTVEGNRGKSEHLDGCRGGGIYLFECDTVTIRRCAVREYRGDGISFQVSRRVTVEECVAEKNGGLGLHPGSGSQAPVVRGNRSAGNDQDGLYLCWRVQGGVFERNELRDNKGNGISIGHKDTDNVFRDNVIVRNGGPGILFRKESEAMGAHRNVFEGNRVLDNGAATNGGTARASIVVRGPHNDLVFRRNTIGHSGPAGGPGLLVSKAARGLRSEGNTFTNAKPEMATGDE
jgi:hypothetical protein